MEDFQSYSSRLHRIILINDADLRMRTLQEIHLEIVASLFKNKITIDDFNKLLEQVEPIYNSVICKQPKNISLFSDTEIKNIPCPSILQSNQHVFKFDDYLKALNQTKTFKYETNKTIVVVLYEHSINFLQYQLLQNIINNAINITIKSNNTKNNTENNVENTDDVVDNADENVLA